MKRTVFAVIFFTLALVQCKVTAPTTKTTTGTEATTAQVLEDATASQSTILETVGADGFDNTTCDINGTLCSTLEVSATTETSAKANNATEMSTTLMPPIAKEIDRYSSKEICTCDLQRRICDINCCCDLDCSYENKLAFQKCTQDDNRVYDTRFCKYAMYIYKNNTPYEWEVNQNGLFCIVKSNLPPEYTVHKKLVIKNDDEANLQKINRYAWSSVDVNKTEDRFSSNESSYYGQNIWLLKNVSFLRLELPDSFVTSACLGRKAVKFLENLKTKCVQTDLSEENEGLNLETYVGNVTVLTMPKLLNSKWNDTSLMNCPRNICIPIEVKICDGDFENCSNLTRNHTRRTECHVSFFDNEKTCRELVHKLKYHFYHDGVKGLKKAVTYVILKNDTFDLRKPNQLLQEFEVSYFWTNHTLNYSSLRSGNPGYGIGKPILVGNLLSARNITNSTRANATKSRNDTIVRNYLDVADNFMVFPANKNGLCFFSNGTNVPVEFGFNMVLSCKIGQIVQAGNLSAKSACAEIQRVIFSYWSVKPGNGTVNVSKVVGTFGNADSNRLGDWSKVFYSVSDESILNRTAGSFENNGQSLTCKHLYTSLKVDIYHGREVIKDLHNQEKIVWTSYLFGSRQDVKFPVNKSKVQVGVGLRTEIMFYDITTEKVKKFADPPTFEIKLPYDFFYPFIKVSSRGNGVSCSLVLVYFFALEFIFILLDITNC